MGGSLFPVPTLLWNHTRLQICWSRLAGVYAISPTLPPPQPFPHFFLAFFQNYGVGGARFRAGGGVTLLMLLSTKACNSISNVWLGGRDRGNVPSTWNSYVESWVHPMTTYQHACSHSNHLNKAALLCFLTDCCLEKTNTSWMLVISHIIGS